MLTLWVNGLAKFANCKTYEIGGDNTLKSALHVIWVYLNFVLLSIFELILPIQTASQKLFSSWTVEESKINLESSIVNT